MSRTTRNSPIRIRPLRGLGESFMDWEKGQWRRLPPRGKGDSKPWNERHRVKDVAKFKVWRCRCHDYCVPGKLHKHQRASFPIHWELKQLQ